MDIYSIEIIRRTQSTKQTLGTLTVFKNDEPIFTCITLERGWLDNKRMESCVPIGSYPIFYEYSNRFQRELWELKDVPNRSEIKIHPSNYATQLNGCIALGNGSLDINEDGYSDITNSRNTTTKFHRALRRCDMCRITIKDDENIMYK